MRIKGKWFCILALGISILTVPCAWAAEITSEAQMVQLREEGRAAVAEDDFARGAAILEKVCAYIEKNKLYQDEKNIYAFVKLAIAYLDMKNFAQARDTVHKAIPLCEQYLHEPLGLLSCLMILGRADTGLGAEAEAVQAFEKFRALALKEYGAEHNDILVTTVELVVLYNKLGEQEKCLALLLPNEKKIRRILGISRDLSAEVRIILAEHYVNSRRYAEAIEVAEEILPVAEYAFGPQEARTKRLLAALEQAYAQSGKTAEAQKMGQEAAAAVKKTREELKPKLDQGKAYLQKKDYSMAIMTLSDVYRYLDDKQLLFTYEGSVAMTNLINTYVALDQVEKAREISKKGLQIGAQYYGLQDRDTINMADQYARNNIRLRDNKAAIDTVEKYLPYSIKFFGAEAEETVSLKLLLGTALTYDHQYAKALETLEQSLPDMARVYGQESGEMVRALTYMNMSYSGLGRGEEAVQSGRKALDLSLKVHGPDSGLTLEIMLYLSQSYIQTGQFDQAIETLERALERARKVLGPRNADTKLMEANLKLARLGKIIVPDE